MRKTALMATVGILAIGTTMTSCKKEKAKTKTDFLTDPAGWVMTKAEMSTNGSAFIDVTGSIPSCTIDDRTYFQAGGVLKVDEGATKCNASDPQTTTSTWSMIENDTKLIMDGTDTFNITTLTESNLNMDVTGDLNGNNVTLRANFVH